MADKADPTPTPEPTQPEAAPKKEWPQIATGVREVGGLTIRESMLGGASARDEVPLLLWLPSVGRELDDDEHGLDAWPSAARLVVVGGPLPYEAGGRSWYEGWPHTGGGDDPTLAKGINEAADRVAAVLRELLQQRPVAGRPVAVGHQQGADVVFALAVRHPDLVGQAIPVSGWMPQTTVAKAPADDAPTIRAIHGERDLVSEIDLTRELIVALQGAGWDASLHEIDKADAYLPQLRDAMHAQLRHAVPQAPP